MPPLSTYTARITSEHSLQPNYMAAIALTLQPFADASAFLASLPTAFDLDIAIGAQLDAVGQWVGISRRIATPIAGVYFSLDTAGLGFDQGVWQGPFDPTEGLVSLDDNSYRTLLRAKIAANNWDGTLAGALAVLSLVLIGKTGLLYIEDRQDMSMIIGLAGTLPDAVTQALISPRYLHVTPAGVHADFLRTSSSGSPIFGFDVDNSYIGGFDNGAWAVAVS